MLADPTLNMVLLDEITYMVAYDYLPLDAVLAALQARPAHQTVIITGRGCIGIFWTWPIPSANYVRLNMRLMQESKRRSGLITKKKPG
jgi:hypothetical protein